MDSNGNMILYITISGEFLYPIKDGEYIRKNNRYIKCLKHYAGNAVYNVNFWALYVIKVGTEWFTYDGN